MTANGMNYIAPVHGMDSDAFQNRIANVDIDAMPDFYDGNGDIIDKEDIKRGWYNNPGGADMFDDRFVLIDTGIPGEYFVMDRRGTSRTARTRADVQTGLVSGTYLLDKNDNYYIVRLNTTPIKNRYRRTYKKNRKK